MEVSVPDNSSVVVQQTVSTPVRVSKKGYKVHPLDRMVHSRMKTVRLTNEDGTVTKARMEVSYKKPRYERDAPIINLGKTYPFGSKRQGFVDAEAA